ncbi:MAG: SIS domain-containing protein [Candidatus Omnitrophica bacterium]|nr:SIS domain-containing protein [Candidatus Omnitrophota bacterium]
MTNEKGWLSDYLERYRQVLAREEILEDLARLKALLQEISARGNKVILAGNGGSAAIASHCAVDFTKNAGVRCVNFNEADLITCLANDFGYEEWLKKALEFYADDGDGVILISSSGKSPNMVQAGRYAVGRGLTLVTFTGFEADNPLKQLGAMNLWVDSRAYNIIEMTHQIWLLAVCDLIIGKAEYPARKELDDVLAR